MRRATVALAVACAVVSGGILASTRLSRDAAQPPRQEIATAVYVSDRGERMTAWEHQGVGSYWVGEELIFRGKATGSQ